MPLITGSDALNSTFTPAATPFIVQATGTTQRVKLVRRNVTAAAWAMVADVTGLALVVDNPVAGAEYQFQVDGSPVNNAGVSVRADQ